MDSTPSAAASEWVTGLVLGASKAPLSSLIGMGTYHGKTGTYEIFGVETGEDDVVGPLVQTDVYRLYVARMPSGQLGLMKTNTMPDAFDALEREARILAEMQELATRYDTEATSRKKTPYYHGAQFPNPVETFSPTAGRYVMFLGYHPSITTYKQLVPLSVLLRDRRVDLQTLVWMFGKHLKLLSFVHGSGHTVGLTDATNTLVETDLHGVFALDFSGASQSPMKIDYLTEVVDAARIAWWAAGGTDTNNPPYDNTIMSHEHYDEFVLLMERIMYGETGGAEAEHEALYEMANRIWPPEMITKGGETVPKRLFHPYVDYPR